MTDAAEITAVAPLLGQHNGYVFGEIMGLSAAEQARLMEAGVTTQPIADWFHIAGTLIVLGALQDQRLPGGDATPAATDRLPARLSVIRNRASFRHSK